jgi:hypothetical protein
MILEMLRFNNLNFSKWERDPYLLFKVLEKPKAYAYKKIPDQITQVWIISWLDIEEHNLICVLKNSIKGRSIELIDQLINSFWNQG